MPPGQPLGEPGVRDARPGDEPTIAAVQAGAWHAAYGDLLGADRLRQLTPQALISTWRTALATVPDRHRIMVGTAGEHVVAVAAVGPSADRDAAAEDAELSVLLVDPAHQRQGHGSRLLAATARAAAEAGFERLRVWSPAADQARRTFLAAAGLEADGASRRYEGEGGRQVAEIRLAARLPGPPPGAQ
jgi:GNAT superfamily N-acetyltransferase